MTIKVKVIIGGICLDQTFDSSAIAMARLRRLEIWDFELVPVFQIPDIVEEMAHAFIVIDKHPGVTLEEFTDRIVQIYEDEFTAAGIKQLFEETKHLHSKIYPTRTTLPLPELAFLLFKENDYNWMKAYHALQKECNLSKREALDAIRDAGLV